MLNTKNFLMISVIIALLSTGLNFTASGQEWNPADPPSDVPVNMPKTYTKAKDMSDLTDYIKEALECAQFRFSGEGGPTPYECPEFKVDTLFFIANDWEIIKDEKYPYSVISRKIRCVLLSNDNGKWRIRCWNYHQDADGNGGFKKACKWSYVAAQGVGKKKSCDGEEVNYTP